MSSGNLPFSMEKLSEQCGGNKMVIGAVMEEFFNQVPKDIAAMEAGLAPGGDLQEAAKAAHRLKGTGGTFGADKLHALCTQLEMFCKAGNSQEAQALFPELKTASQASLEAVNAAKSTL